MSENNYTNFVANCLRTECPYEPVIGRLVMDPGKLRLLHGAIICATEAGELLDAVKKHLFYGKELDRTNLTEERGDILYGLALVTEYLGESTLTVAIRAEIEKLKVRYPEKYTDHHANNRDLPAERVVMEGPSAPSTLDFFE
jgi:NTP pyrophosphatase (non-canonical NTP hydrolase)